MYVAFGASKRFAISIGACNILSVFLGSFLLVGLKDQLESSEAVDYIPTFAGECRGRRVVLVLAPVLVLVVVVRRVANSMPPVFGIAIRWCTTYCPRSGDRNYGF